MFSWVWIAISRPSGIRKEVNSTSARCRGVKSPPNTALVRSNFETGSRRLTWPITCEPAGITSRSNA